MSSLLMAAGAMILVFSLVAMWIPEKEEREKTALEDILVSATTEERRYQELRDPILNNPYNRFYRQYARHWMKWPIFARWFLKMTAKSQGTMEEKINQAGWHTVFSVEEWVSVKILGMVFGGALLVLFAATQSMLFLFLGAITVFIGVAGIEIQVDRAAKRRRIRIIKELPEFLSLLADLIDTGAAIDQAILRLVGEYKKDNLVVAEFREAMKQASMRGDTWKTALEAMSYRNQIEELSLVVSDILISSEKGTPLFDTLKRQAKEMEALREADIDKRARQKTVSLLLPIMVFTVLPILAMIMLPALVSMSQGGF